MTAFVCFAVGSTQHKLFYVLKYVTLFEHGKKNGDTSYHSEVRYFVADHCLISTAVRPYSLFSFQPIYEETTPFLPS